jgi:hypothetical protein
MATYYDIDSLISNYEWKATDEFNGMTTSKGRQLVTVIQAARVPADWRHNPNLMGRATVEGKRGAQYSANIMQIDGRTVISLL